MNIVLIGPPGCGKGTQAERIVEEFSLEYVSTGNLIRNEIISGTPLGERVKEISRSGHYVDDKTVIELVKNHISDKNALLFDGFPRTVEQAEALDALRPVDLVLDLDVDDEIVVKRISSRWMVDQGEEQHTFRSKEDATKYAQENGGRVFQRKDDKPEVVKSRLEDYHKLTEPIIYYYKRQKNLAVIDGNQSIEKVWADIKKAFTDFDAK